MKTEVIAHLTKKDDVWSCANRPTYCFRSFAERRAGMAEICNDDGGTPADSSGAVHQDRSPVPATVDESQCLAESTAEFIVRVFQRKPRKNASGSERGYLPIDLLFFYPRRSA